MSDAMGLLGPKPIEFRMLNITMLNQIRELHRDVEHSHTYII